jgi:hypothetical protein
VYQIINGYGGGDEVITNEHTQYHCAIQPPAACTTERDARDLRDARKYNVACRGILYTEFHCKLRGPPTREDR